MSILSGFFKTIKYRMTDSGYKWQSEKTSSQTVVMGDGTDDTDTVEKRFGKIKGITSSLASTSTTYALSASAGKDLQDQISDLNTNLDKHKSSGDHDTRYYTRGEVNIKLEQLLKHNSVELKAGRSIYLYPTRIGGYKLISATTNNSACFVRYFTLGNEADTIELSAVPEKDSVLYLTYTPCLY